MKLLIANYMGILAALNDQSQFHKYKYRFNERCTSFFVTAKYHFLVA